MEWQRIDFSGVRGESKITLRKNLQVGLNTTFVKKHDIQNYESVELYVSSDKNKIGLRFSKEPEGNKNAKLKKLPNNYFFVAKELQTLYDIDPKKYQFGNYKYDKEEDMFVVDLILNEE